MIAPTAGETYLRGDDGARLAVSCLTPLKGPAAVGPPVVLAHGWGGSRRVWGSVADGLIRSGHTVLSYDLRGHGASTVGDDGITAEAMRADLATVLRYAGGAAVVAGHSGGGFAALAQAVADDPGARPVGLVLVATAAHGQDTPEKEARMMGAPLFSRALRSGGPGRLLLRQMTGTALHPRLREVNRELFAATRPEVRAECFRSSRGMDLREDLAAVRVPVEVLAGGADKIIAPRLGRETADALPRARFTSLPGAGHLLPLEHPRAVSRAIEEVTRQAGGRPTGRLPQDTGEALEPR
ncbi:alpha/beta fold hydrolase [Streptomyces sp. NPDC054765]